MFTNTFTGDGSTVAFTTTSTLTTTLQTPLEADGSVSTDYVGIPADQIDVFIGGQRVLRISEDGSTLNYSISGNVVTLTTAPASGTQVKILHKKGQVWYTANDGNPADGKGLQGSTSIQARFIAEEPTNAPE